MTFLAPWSLVAAAAAALAVVALHLLARRRPRSAAFPTARFVPDVTVRAASRTAWPSDALLLALRVLTALLAGAAVAGPVLAAARRPVARVVAVDISRAARTPGEGVTRAGPLLRDGDAVVVFDSSARVVRARRADTLRSLLAAAVEPGPGARPAGSLSAALARAIRVAAAMSRDADSVELVLVSPLAEEEWDAATLAVRALWPGRVLLEQTALAVAPSALGAVDIRAAPDDPLRATLGLAPRAPGSPAARVVRTFPTGVDSAWARDGGALVHWPAAPRGAGWSPVSRADSVGAVVTASAVVVAPFERAAPPPGGRVIARWVDGTPAATEIALGRGCVRNVAVAVPAAGDLVLRESVHRFMAALLEPCGGAPALSAPHDTLVRALAGAGSPAATRALAAAPAHRSAAAPWLLAAALLLAATEPLLRRTGPAPGQRAGDQ